jgi:hypothetical protein
MGSGFIGVFPIRKDTNMKNIYNVRRSLAVLMFIGWSALQSSAQTELIQNGGFESGTANWTLGGGAIVDSTAGYARSGSSYLFMGGLENEVDFCYQQITIPANATSATLSFYYNILTQDDPSAPYDTFSATIRDTGNNVLATVLNRSNQNYDNAIGPSHYHQQTFDLVPYAGQTILVYFASANDFSLPTSFNIDDVSVQVTTGGGGNQRPVATPQNVSVNYNASLPITLTATDADGDPLTYSIATPPSNGSLSGAPPNVTYQPNFNYSGPDSFTFIANDGKTNSAPATISITVNPPLAGLIINPVWDTTILNDPNAATIMNTISNAMLVYETKFSDPVTVQITFAEMTGGLGQSSTFIGPLSYSSYYNALVADSKTTNDVLALANLPGGSVNPADGTSNIRVTTANQRALGFAANPPPGSSDSTISLNMSIINIDRISINPGKYDLMAVVSHEIDEALGTSSGLPTAASGRPPDLFRFTAAGVRTNTTSGDDAWFSINGGVTDLARYNQNNTGDYGDWWSIGVAHTPRVQDAAGTPGVIINLGVELTVLDVIGWDLVIPAPTPTIQGVARIGNTINFSWASSVGHGYQVQYKTNLNQVGWLNLNSPITAVGSVTSASDTIGTDARRSYRIALLTSSPAPPTVPLVTLPSTGPFTLVTNYYLPQQAAGMKGQSVTSFPAKAFKSQVRVQAQRQE